jgi:hypothetical protein
MWTELEAIFPAAHRWRGDLARMPVAHLATVDRRGDPRIHPVCPHHAFDRMYLAVTPLSPKRHDLADRGRYALHSINVDDPGPDFDEFELTVSGTARRVPSDKADVWAAVREVCPYPIPDDDWLFELAVDRALTTVWDPIGAPGRSPHRLMWREGWSAPRPPSNELAS